MGARAPGVGAASRGAPRRGAVVGRATVGGRGAAEAGARPGGDPLHRGADPGARPRETVDWRTWAVFTEWHGRALGLSKRMRLELARLKAWRHLHRNSPEWGRLGRPPTPPDVVYWRSRAKEALWVLQRVREHLDDRGNGGLPEELVARVREVCRPPGETEQQEQEG